MFNSLSRYEPQALGALRIITGLLFLEHGTQKFLSFPPGKMAGMGVNLANLGAYAGIIELLCGLLITIGLLTRPAAFELRPSAVMAPAPSAVTLPESEDSRMGPPPDCTDTSRPRGTWM